MDKKHTNDIMQALANAIDEALNGGKRPKTLGFALLVYPFNDGPEANNINYTGNGERKDVLVAIKELAARWEGRHIEAGSRQ